MKGGKCQYTCCVSFSVSTQGPSTGVCDSDIEPEDGTNELLGAVGGVSSAVSVGVRAGVSGDVSAGVSGAVSVGVRAGVSGGVSAGFSPPPMRRRENTEDSGSDTSYLPPPPPPPRARVAQNANRTTSAEEEPQQGPSADGGTWVSLDQEPSRILLNLLRKCCINV